ncbi:hypothetical protein NDU88_006359 [Pleurodeles waltl]|uniref:Uncharacterized protein n=1 Tax=Pleurodeles waltl TaxID=8319 RepID=A0AAV7N0M0_PLEWA|nr:hypothetical protein NDU88_006359 [Pleurodeles waltl]
MLDHAGGSMGCKGGVAGSAMTPPCHTEDTLFSRQGNVHGLPLDLLSLLMQTLTSDQAGQSGASVDFAPPLSFSGVGDGEVAVIRGHQDGEVVAKEELDYDEYFLEEADIVDEEVNENEWWEAPHDLPHGHSTSNGRGCISVLQQPALDLATARAV